MVNFVCYVFVVAMLAAFAITLANKRGLIEYVQVHGNDFFSEMFRCNFCLSWWTGVVISFVAFVVTWNPAFFAVPFCSTMLTRHML